MAAMRKTSPKKAPKKTAAAKNSNCGLIPNNSYENQLVQLSDQASLENTQEEHIKQVGIAQVS